jgi:glucosamine-6-phosphate deaminase
MNVPEYLAVAQTDLGSGTTVRIEIAGDPDAVAQHFARALFDEIKAQPDVALILPVGPVDQFPILAQMINEARLDCREVLIINMDEYLADDDSWIPANHPLSFRGYMDRMFYRRVDPDLAPVVTNRIFPDPEKAGEIAELIERRGGLGACYGGIGINGHIAFNEPPEPDEDIEADAFMALPTRVLSLSRETRTINANTVGGEISVIPRRAITVGMKDILGAQRLRFYCNRPWQSAVIRRVLHGPVTPHCPASFLRTHPDASITIADYVSQPPDIRLR